MTRTLAAATLAACAALAACDLLSPKKDEADPFKGFVVRNTTDDDQGALGATNGVTYLVPWVTTNAFGSFTGLQLLGDTGRVKPPLALAANNGDIGGVAWNGVDRYLAVLQEGVTAGASDLYGHWVTALGDTTLPPIRITASGNAPTLYSVTYGTGGVFLVTYGRLEFDAGLGDSIPMSFARVVSGTSTVGPEISIGTRGQISASTFNGTNFVIIYHVNGAGAQLRGRLLSTAGAQVSDVALSTAGTSVATPMAVAWNGSNVGVAYGNRVPGDPEINANAITFTLYTAALVGTGHTYTQTLPGSVGRVNSLVASDSGFFLAYIEGDGSGNYKTMGLPFTPAGDLKGSGARTLFAPDAKASSYSAYYLPAIGSKFLALVNRKINGNWDLYGEGFEIP